MQGYVTYFVAHNKNKTERQLIKIYFETKRMKDEGKINLANLIQTGLIYVLSSKPAEFRKRYNYIKTILEKRNEQNGIYQDHYGIIS